MIPLVKRALPEARLPFQDVSVLGVAAAASLTGALARKRVRGVGGESIAALVSVAPALFALRGGELAQYHGVEHKAIAAYEQDAEDARRRLEGARALRLAPRGAAARLEPGGHRCCCGARSSGRARWRAERSRSPPPRWPSRCSRGASATARRGSRKALRRPGFEIQRVIGTREPDERQLEVGRAALAEILRVEA